MKEILQQFIPQMTRGEKIELLAALKEAIAKELAVDGKTDPQVCPRCGCPIFVKKGRSKSGCQRWLCRQCGHTFSHKTMGLLSLSKLGAQTWMTFAECMADTLSLRESARRCGVSLYTAWYMRMRVLEIMSYRLAPVRAGTFQIDDTHFVKNLSGNHKRCSWFTMPRKAHRNGKDGRIQGGSRTKNRIDVACGINEFGDCFCEVLSVGIASAGDANMVTTAKIPLGSTIILDGDKSYGAALKGRAFVVIDPNDNTTGNINMVNALHSRLKEFIRRFHGVSLRRMQRYLDWFCWREQVKMSDADKRELLYSQEASGRYLYTRNLTHLEARPFLSYSERQRYAAMNEFMSILV